MCRTSDPSFPYCLHSYKDVDVYPLAEFWHKKPYLYTGSGSGPDGEFTWYYDVEQRKKIEFKGMAMFRIPIDGVKVSTHGEWTSEYIDSLRQFQFRSKQSARDHGHNYKNLISLVFLYNSEWGLFRMQKGIFRSIYLPRLTEILTLKLKKQK